jgi:hypothetical protein
MPELSNFDNLPTRAATEYCRRPAHFETTQLPDTNCEHFVTGDPEIMRGASIRDKTPKL